MFIGVLRKHHEKVRVRFRSIYCPADENSKHWLQAWFLMAILFILQPSFCPQLNKLQRSHLSPCLTPLSLWMMLIWLVKPVETRCPGESETVQSTVCQVIRTRCVKDELEDFSDEQGTHTQLLQNKQLWITLVLILKGSSDATCTFTSCLN